MGRDHNPIRSCTMLLLSLLSSTPAQTAGAMPNRTGVRNPPTGKGEGHLHSLLAILSTHSSSTPSPQFCSGVAGGRTEMSRSGASCGAAEPVQILSTHSRAAHLQLHKFRPTARDDLSSRRRARTGIHRSALAASSVRAADAPTISLASDDASERTDTNTAAYSDLYP